jgi:D-aminopeptidase
MKRDATRPRLRDLGIAIGRYPAGPFNAITDIGGICVGHVTLIEGERTRTGVTAILPHGGNLYRERVPAGLSVFNGFGKFAGATQLMELGEIETPILLTNTLATGRAVETIHRWTLSQPGNERLVSINAIVGETNDSRLNDIRAPRPAIDEMLQALDSAAPGPVTEGCVGAGTGTVCFGYKGGIGTSSRIIETAGSRYTLGVLTQTNFGGTLRIDGHPLAPSMQADHDGSVILIIACDAPLSDRQLTRLAARAHGGLARAGAALSHGSGDYALAFSTAPGARRTCERRAGAASIDILGDDALSPLFEAVIEAAEEAIINSLTAATGMKGYDAGADRENHIAALPLEYVRALATRP